jgi:hypothetical protein
MTIYTVRFCDKELVAYNLRDFARIAVFAKWYIRSQSTPGGPEEMQCSVEQQQEIPVLRKMASAARASSPSARTRRSRIPRASVMRKALRSLFYTVLC